jgi:hypothetical protein
MTDTFKVRTRAATIADAEAIGEICNQGIADRIATFETEPRSVRDIAGWLTPQHVVDTAGAPHPQGERCQTSRERKIVAAAPIMQARPQVPKLSIQAALCDVPPN